MLYRVLPLLWLLATAAAAWLMRQQAGVAALMIPVALVPPLLMRWQMGRLPHVSTDGERLYLSIRGEEVTLPFTEILDVREHPGTGRNRVPTVVVTFRSVTPLGREIRFVPRMRWQPETGSFAGSSSPPGDTPIGTARELWGALSVAEELRQRAGLVHGK